MKRKIVTCRTVLRRCAGLVPVNRQGMEMVQVAILVAIAVTLGLVYFLPVDPIIKCIVVLGICFPTAATVSMLAEQEGQKEEAASKVLFLSTVVSIVTIPCAVNLLMSIFM